MIPAHRVMLEHIADTWERIAVDIEGAQVSRPQLGTVYPSTRVPRC